VLTGSAIDMDAASAMLTATWIGCRASAAPADAEERPMGKKRFAAAVFDMNVPMTSVAPPG
jgi:hypothetical protein